MVTTSVENIAHHDNKTKKSEYTCTTSCIHIQTPTLCSMARNKPVLTLILAN